MDTVNVVSLSSKPFYKSKTFWLGALNIVIGVCTYLSGQIDSGAAITLNGILIIVLRVITNRAVTIA